MGDWKLPCQLGLLMMVVVTWHSTEAAGRPHWLNRLDQDGAVGEPAKGKTWAVLVAGSSEWGNYRHQADVCHAYQILKRGGLKDENIVVFMYDDIANNPLNPRPGVIINKPEGSDVYAGVPKDYTGESVTVENFFAVILANKTGLKGGSGKVVDSKPEDRIFIYYTDHGGPGTLSMPSGPDLYAKDFIKVLKKKSASGTYKEMVIYVEACESGSIFEGLLPDNLNIYVTTASNATENSWGTYCPDMKPPPPPGFDTCLGDLYSVAWMEDSDLADRKRESLQEQYVHVRARTINNQSEEGSHVMQYGTKSISSEMVYLYQGLSSGTSSGRGTNGGPMGVVNQRDGDVFSMRKRYTRLADGSKEKADLLQEITEVTSHRAHLDGSVAKIGENLFGLENGRSVLDALRPQGSPLVDDWGCLKTMVRAFEASCGSLTQYGLKHMRAFANICNNGVTAASMERASAAACAGYNPGKFSPSVMGYSA